MCSKPDGELEAAFLLLPDALSMNVERSIHAPRTLKNAPGGFPLNVWFIHPDQLKNTMFNEPGNRENIAYAAQSVGFVFASEVNTSTGRRPGAETIGELESKTGIKYLASILDLTKEDVPKPVKLKNFVLDHLENTYGVDETDRVDLFFHSNGFTHPNNITCHLHIRVNERLHPFEEFKLVALDDIIDTLSSGKTTTQLMAEKGAFCSLSSGNEMLIDYVKDLPGLELTEIESPFI